MLLAGGPILARGANLAGDQHFRTRLKVKSPEDSYGIQRLKLWCCFGMFESSEKIKGLDDGMIIRCLQPDDFSVAGGRFRQKIGIGSDKVRKLHLRLVRVSARAQHMPLQVNRRRVIRSDRKDVNLIAILHREAAQLGANRLGIAGFSNLNA